MIIQDKHCFVPLYFSLIRFLDMDVLASVAASCAVQPRLYDSKFLVPGSRPAVPNGVNGLKGHYHQAITIIYIDILLTPLGNYSSSQEYTTTNYINDF